jgi:putative spermidine/putrescine transport system permease protein
VTVANATTTDLVEQASGLSATGPAPKRMPRFAAEPTTATRAVILVIAGIFLLLPIVAMLEFSLRNGQPVKGVQSYSFIHYLAVFDPVNAFTYGDLFDGVGTSLVLAVLTVVIVLVLLLPVMIMVELRYPKLRRVLEFICLTPITVPTIVLVVGFVPVYQGVAQIFGSTPYTLAFAIGIISLPYAYRPIAANMAAVEMVILSEASRSLGAGWASTIGRVILPNLRRGILASCFITIAVVLGEYTLASFLSQNTFQTALVLVQHTDPYVAVIFALGALIFGFVLLLIIGRVGASRPGTRRSRRAS